MLLSVFLDVYNRGLRGKKKLRSHVNEKKKKI